MKQKAGASPLIAAPPPLYGVWLRDMWFVGDTGIVFSTPDINLACAQANHVRKHWYNCAGVAIIGEGGAPVQLER